MATAWLVPYHTFYKWFDNRITRSLRYLAKMATPKGMHPVFFFFRMLIDILYINIYSIPSLFVAIYYMIGTRPSKSVKGEIILITGAGQGLGREMCREFTRLGAELICVDLNGPQNQETVNMIRDAGGKARGYVCDVSDRTAIQKLANEVGRVDILINNAGIYPVKGLWNATEQEIRVIMDINLLSQFWTAQAFLPGMKKRNHGHFVSIASIAGLSGLAYMEPYSVSKAGLITLMDTLRHEMRIEKRPNIKLTTICPYFVKTRAEIKDCCVARIPPLEVDEALKDIMQGILQEIELCTVPSNLMLATNLTKIYSWTYWNKWYETFYARINEPNEDLLKMYLDENVLGTKTGNLTAQA